jgi:hypothetical protein
VQISRRFFCLDSAHKNLEIQKYIFDFYAGFKPKLLTGRRTYHMTGRSNTTDFYDSARDSFSDQDAPAADILCVFQRRRSAELEKKTRRRGKDDV